MTFERRSLLTISLVFAAILGYAPAHTTAQQRKVPMQAQAQRVAVRPMKLDIHVANQSAIVGSSVSSEVRLLNAENQESQWEKTTHVQIEISSSAGNIQRQVVTIPAWRSSAPFSFSVHESGYVSLTATDADNILRPGGNSIVINRPPSKKLKRVKPTELLFRRQTQPRVLQVSSIVTFESGRDEQQPEDFGNAASGQKPTLLLANATGREEILADGKDSARIRVFFMDPDGNPAPSDIKVWLSWSNGELSPQPLVIKKGEMFADAEWFSGSPVNATVSLVAAGPRYDSAIKRELTVSFVPPIYGIGTPCNNPLKLSLIDAAPLTAQFFDQYGHSIQTSKARQITFISSKPWVLHLDPGAKDVQVNEAGTSIFLIPTWGGDVELDIWSPGYDHQKLTVQISVWLVLLLCAIGGVVGGAAAKGKLQGSLVWRLFTGVLGAIVLVWLIVYAVLPLTHSVIAHNLVSVLVVAMIGGYGGTGVLDWALKKFTSSSPTPDAA